MLGIAELDTILDPESSDSDILAALHGLELQHINKDTISAAVERIRQTADFHPDLAIDLHELGRFSIDCSGTGGSGVSHFNTSTCVAFVLSALGIKVAKFGGRAASGKAGSFDFLEGLGIPSTLPAHKIEDALSVCGVAFIFAPQIYPQLRRIGPLRKKFGKPTLFNYIGPLLNPVRPASRLMGISSDRARKLVADQLLDDEKTNTAMLVTAGGVLDELAVDQISDVSFIDAKQVREFQMDPTSIPKIAIEPAAGAAQGLELDATSNLRIFNNIISGKDTSSLYYKMLLLNTAAALFVLKTCASIEEGIIMSADLIEAGSVAESVATCRRFYDRLSA